MQDLSASVCVFFYTTIDKQLIFSNLHFHWVIASYFVYVPQQKLFLMKSQPN